MGRFQLRAVKHSITKNDMTHRSHCDHPSVVCIGDIDTPQDLPLFVSFSIPIPVPHEDEPRLVGDNHPIIIKGQPVRNREMVREDRRLVRPPITIRIFQDKNFIMGKITWDSPWERRHRHNPEATPGVEGDLLRVP